jgi:hypothetical protein
MACPAYRERMPDYPTKDDIAELARATQEQFANIDEQLVDVKATLLRTHAETTRGQARLLEAVLDIPSKKTIEDLATKVQAGSERLTKVEHQLRTAA